MVEGGDRLNAAACAAHQLLEPSFFRCSSVRGPAAVCRRRCGRGAAAGCWGWLSLAPISPLLPALAPLAACSTCNARVLLRAAGWLNGCSTAALPGSGPAAAWLWWCSALCRCARLLHCCCCCCCCGRPGCFLLLMRLLTRAMDAVEHLKRVPDADCML